MYKRQTLPIPEESLGQWDAAMDFQIPPGQIRWFLSDGGEDLLTGDFRL